MIMSRYMVLALAALAWAGPDEDAKLIEGRLSTTNAKWAEEGKKQGVTGAQLKWRRFWEMPGVLEPLKEKLPDLYKQMSKQFLEMIGKCPTGELVDAVQGFKYLDRAEVRTEATINWLLDAAAEQKNFNIVTRFLDILASQGETRFIKRTLSKIAMSNFAKAPVLWGSAMQPLSDWVTRYAQEGNIRKVIQGEVEIKNAESIAPVFIFARLSELSEKDQDLVKGVVTKFEELTGDTKKFSPEKGESFLLALALYKCGTEKGEIVEAVENLESRSTLTGGILWQGNLIDMVKREQKNVLLKNVPICQRIVGTEAHGRIYQRIHGQKYKSY